MRGTKAGAQARQRGPLPSQGLCSGVLHVAATAEGTDLRELGMAASAVAAVPGGWQTPCPLALPALGGQHLSCVGTSLSPSPASSAGLGFADVKAFGQGRRGSRFCVWLQGVDQVGSRSSVLELRVWLHLSWLR